MISHAFPFYLSSRYADRLGFEDLVLAIFRYDSLRLHAVKNSLHSLTQRADRVFDYFAQYLQSNISSYTLRALKE